MGADSGVRFAPAVEVSNFPVDFVETGFYALPKYCFFVDKPPRKCYAKRKIYVEVVDLSDARYPNRDALRKAHDIYLDAIYPFMRECLGKFQGTTAEELIRDALSLASHDNIEKKIEISDIAHLVRTYWYDYFQDRFEAIDPHYEARSAIGLIVEGRNRASHRPWDLDPEFTRTQLFLIAEVLEKINRPDAQREVETIRNDLFENTTQQLVEIAVKEEKAQHKKSIAEVKERLTAEEKKNDKLSKQKTDNAAKLKKKEEDLEKLSEQLVGVKLREKKYKTQLNSKSKQLEKVQAVHSACKERLTSTEAERDDYKESLETASKELREAETEWQACEDSLTAMRNLFTVSTIGNMVFPPFETDSTVRILDRRGVDKQNYLLNLLEQKQSTVIYVQSEERIDQLLAFVGPEKADVIGKCNARTSEAEEAEIFGKLEKGELIAVVSNTAFSTLASPHCIEHFVFCHLVAGLDEFFKQCEPAFASEKHAYLHLIYNSEQDSEGLAQKYPDREMLVETYRELKKLAEANEDFIKTENVYSKLDIGKPSIETGLAVFEELQLLKQNGESIKLLPDVRADLDQSEIYRRGEKLKKKTADFRAFQLEYSIEQIWAEILEKLDISSEQILREVNTDEMSLSVSEMENDLQPTETVENDSEPDDADIEANQTPIPPSANAKVTEEQVREIQSRSAAGESNSELAKEFNLSSTAIRFVVETTEETRNEIAVKVVELRINEEGSRPIAWRRIREELDLHNDHFHDVIRHSEGYRNAVIERVKSLKSAEGGWEYNGKLSVLTGIEDIENYLD